MIALGYLCGVTVEAAAAVLVEAVEEVVAAVVVVGYACLCGINVILREGKRVYDEICNSLASAWAAFYLPSCACVSVCVSLCVSVRSPPERAGPQRHPGK